MVMPQMASQDSLSCQEMLRCIWGHFLRVIQGTSPTLSHSASLLHSLGSVTVRTALEEGAVVLGLWVQAVLTVT